MDNTDYLSQDKFDQLQDELNHLKMVERKQIAEQLEYAKSLGDLSENAEYHEARDKQADLEDRIKELENILKSSIIIDQTKTKTKGDVVGVGSEVIVRKTGGDDKQYTIVGSEEADMATGKISYLSPLGSSLLNRKKGESVTVSTPRGDMKYVIVDTK